MKKAMIVTLVLVLLAALVLVGASCGDDGDGGGETPEEAAKRQLCEDLNDLEAALQGVTNINLQTAKEDLDTNLTAIEDAWNDVVASAKEVTGLKIGNLTSAVEGLIETIEGIPETGDISASITQIESDVNAVVEAWNQLTEELNCEELTQ